MNRWWGWRPLIAVSACALVLLSLAACSVFFDGVDAPRPPTRRLRRDLLLEIEQLKRDLLEAKAREAAAQKAATRAEERPPLPVEGAKGWQEAAEMLPKDQAGHVDWMAALKAGVIAPRQAFDPKAPEQPVLDLDVEFASSPTKLFKATYPHNPHTRWLACGNCHPGIFPLKKGAQPIVMTMAKIKAGQYCGVCHGRVAFGIEGECGRCHTGAPAKAQWRPPEEPRKPIEAARGWVEASKLIPVTAGMPDWAKALAEEVIAPRPGVDPQAVEQPVFPLEVELVPADNPLFKVVFPHQTHTALLACGNCHPAIFQMAKGADPITMTKIYAGEYCGRCHGKVAFAVPTGCPRCHPAMGGQ